MPPLFLLNLIDEEGCTTTRLFTRLDGSIKDLRSDYYHCLGVVKEKDPADWMLSDVFSMMEERGWQRVDAEETSVFF